MRVEEALPVNGVKVYVVGDPAIYMRTETQFGPMWYEPDRATLSLKMLGQDDEKAKELEAAYQEYTWKSS